MFVYVIILIAIDKISVIAVVLYVRRVILRVILRVCVVISGVISVILRSKSVSLSIILI